MKNRIFIKYTNDFAAMIESFVQKCKSAKAQKKKFVNKLLHLCTFVPLRFYGLPFKLLLTSFIIAAILILPLVTKADGRDPFMPYAWDKPSPEEIQAAKDNENYDLTPLTIKPLNSYQVAGVIIAPHDSVALIKSRDKREYFAVVGDKLGREGGVIQSMSSEGLVVDMDGKMVDLTINNSRFGISNESE